MVNIRNLVPPFCPLRRVPNDGPELTRHLGFFALEIPGTDPQYIVGRYVEGLIAELLRQNTGSFRSAKANLLNSQSVIDLLTVLKREAKNMIVDLPGHYVEGAHTMYFIHPPALKYKIVQAMSKLPVAVGRGPNNRRLISVQTPQRSYVFQVCAYELDLPLEYVEDPTWMILHLFNPTDPAMELLIPESGSLVDVAPTLALDSTEKLEYAAIELVEQDLHNKQMRAEYTREPNGFATFPDFEACIEGTKWTIEVTRVLTGIAEGRTFRTGARDEESVVAHMVQSSPIGTNKIDDALVDSLEDKGAKAPALERGTKYCLVLVDVANLGIQKGATIWQNKDLSAFDAVIVISKNERRENSVEYIKGCLTARVIPPD